jgi:hypothetical protein
MELNLTKLARDNLDPKIARIVRPSLKSSDFKTLFANRVIDEIVSRTQDGKDKTGKAFKAYSKSYKSSEVFSIYGKGNGVDLTLTGSMLNSMDSKLSGDTIVIFFSDDLDAAKAHGHINGANYLPKRDFFGLPDKVINQLFKESVKDYREVDNLTAAELEA